MSKFVVHWQIFDHQSAAVVDVPDGAYLNAAAGASMSSTTAARRIAYAELMEVFESNSSHGAVPLTAETAREYGVPFEEEPS